MNDTGTDRPIARIGQIAAVLASALAFFFSTGVYHWWPLAWVAPAPVLAVALQSSGRAAALCAFAAYLLGRLGNLPMIAAVLPVPMTALVIIVPAIAFAVVTLLTRAVVRRLQHWLGLFAFPILWTAWEYLASGQGTYGSLGYSQIDALPIAQLAALTGLYGITFVVTLVPAGIAVAWYLRSRRQVIPALAVPFALVALVVAYGAVRLTTAARTPTVRVGVAATDETVRFFRTRRAEEALPVVHAYARRVGALAEQGAEVIVLPEKFVGVTPANLEEVRRILAGAATAHRVRVVAGLNLIETSGPPRNVAWVFDRDGSLIVDYDKIELVPGYESEYRPGSKPGWFETEHGLWGTRICRDMDFPAHERADSRRGVGLLLVPAWDFVNDGWIHARMAIMRGIEGGFAIARSAQEGEPTVSDPYGRVLTEGVTSRTPEVLLTANVHPGAGHTFYARAGDWFPRLCSIAAVLIILVLAVARVRSSRSTQ